MRPENAKIFIETTTVVEEKKSQRKLLGRIKDAIVNKDPERTSTVTTINRIDNKASGQADLTLNVLNDLLRSSIDKLAVNYKQLGEDERRLIITNDPISRLILFVSSILAAVILFNAWLQHERGLVRAGKEAVRRSRLRSDFLSHISHEIRTPLNSILGFSEQLANSDLDNVQKEYIAAVWQSSKILLPIVNDVLDPSKFETGEDNP